MKPMLNTLNIRRSLLIVSDILLLYLSLLATVYFRLGGKFGWINLYEHLLPFSILYFFWLIIFYIFGLYDLNIIKIKETFHTRFFGAISAALAIGLSFFYLFRITEVTPKTNLVLNILIFAVLLFLWRKIFLALFSSRFLTRVAVVGEQNQAQKLAEEINSRPYLGYKIINLETVQDLPGQINEKKIDVILVPPDLVFDSELIKSLYRCLPTRVRFLNWTRAYELIAEKIPVSLVNHVWFLENLGEGEKIFYDKLKRTLDIILAAMVIAATLPFWILIAIFIKLEDRGPVIYTQERVGKDGKPFPLLKFRSMEPEAEKKTGPLWAEEKDRRATKVGAFLRRTHLDELPQMINVLRGEISLVGPRPERPEFIRQLGKEISHYQLRHIIKPGFTGWAQIKFRYGRSVMDSQEKFQYDLYYLKNRSLFLDLGILLKTFQLFFKKD
ncbi:MAG: sugar transferase [bacterium]|nr:sugar transferase [bacterium]